MSERKPEPRLTGLDASADLHAHLASVDQFLRNGRLKGIAFSVGLMVIALRGLSWPVAVYAAIVAAYLIWERSVPRSAAPRAGGRRQVAIAGELGLIALFLAFSRLTPELNLLLGLPVAGYASRYGRSARLPILAGLAVGSVLLLHGVARMTYQQWLYHGVELGALFAVGHLAGQASQRVFRLAKAQGQLARRSRLLLEVLQSVTETLTVDERLKNAADAIERLVGYRTAFYLYDAARDEFAVRTSVVLAPEEASQIRFSPQGTFFESVLATRQPVVLCDLKDNPGLPRFLAGRVPWKAAAIIPIEYEGTVLGTLNAAQIDREQFPTDDLDVLMGVAGLMGQSINNARRHEETERLSIIDDLTGLYNHRYFQADLRNRIRAARESGGHLTLVMLDLDDFKGYNDLFGHQQGDEVLRQVGSLLQEFFPHGGEQGLAARYGGEEFVLLLPWPVQEASRYCEEVRCAIAATKFPGCAVLERGGITASLGAAVFPAQADSSDALIAAADTALYRAKHLGKNRCELYTSVLDAIETEALEHSEIELIKTIKPLVSVINGKDNYTYGHSERVVEHAVAIGELMGLSPHDLQFLSYAAFLHDLGKLEISRELLNKTEALTAEEWDTLKQHPVWGAQMVCGIASLRAIVPAIEHHHERWDGRGYPAGLVGEDIPPFARIIAVADAFDAMITTRPYRREKTTAAALAEITACAGTQFDPDVARLFAVYLADGEGEEVSARSA